MVVWRLSGHRRRKKGGREENVVLSIEGCKIPGKERETNPRIEYRWSKKRERNRRSRKDSRKFLRIERRLKFLKGNYVSGRSRREERGQEITENYFLNEDE